MKFKRILSAFLCLIMLASCNSLSVVRAGNDSTVFKGVDLSVWNGKVDFSKMKSRGVDFAILRCHSVHDDANFLTYYDDCVKAGMPVGAYNYMYATTEEKAKKEAEESVAVLNGRKLEYPYFLDIEDKLLKPLGKAKLTKLCLIELEVFKKAGYNVGIYTSKSFLTEYLDASKLSGYVKWTARWTYYASDKTYYFSVQDPVSSYKPDCAIWQFSSAGKGKYYGTEGERVDMNYCYVDYLKNPGYSSSVNPSDYSVPKTTISQKSTNASQISWVQACLFQLGYRTTVSGKYTDYTASLVSEFQKKNKLTVNGKVDKATVGAMASYLFGEQCIHYRTKIVGEVEPTCIQEGYSGDEICEICGEVIEKGDIVPKSSHDYGAYAVVTPATNKEEGSKIKKCKVCGKKKTVAVSRIESISFSKRSFAYNGQKQYPIPDIKDADGKTVSSKYYDIKLSSKDSKKVGVYTLTLTFKDFYSGQKKITYKIKPSKVKGLKASKVSKTAVALSWNSSPGSSFFEVERSGDGKSWKKVKTVSKNKYTVSGLKTASTCYFRVRALNNDKTLIGSYSSALKTTTLTASPALKAKTDKNGAVSLSWKALTGAKKYRVYISYGSKDWSLKKTTASTSLKLTDLSKNKQVYIKATALNNASLESKPGKTQTVVVGSPKTYVGNVNNGSVYMRKGIFYIKDSASGVSFPLVNKTYKLPENYAPGGLTSACSSAFSKLVSGAKSAGLSLFSVSGYRSFSRQKQLYNSYVKKYGKTYADSVSARPGYSEHQTGLAIDVNSLKDSFANSKEGKWLQSHCTEYGFIIRYGKNKRSSTGYSYEPWHIRYVGSTELAKRLMNSGLSIEEYYNIKSSY